ncbi:kirola [Capsicum chacoense]
MGLKGKLIASLEVKCGGHTIFDIYHANIHHVSNISPSIINKFEIHEGEIVKIGSVVSWNYNENGQKKNVKQVIDVIDPHKKLISWKVIEGDILELYSSFIIKTSCEHQWTTWIFDYEKRTEDTPEPLNILGLILDVTKHIEDHLHKK